MKSRIRLLLCVVLVLAMGTSLFCLSAAADNKFHLTVGENCNGLIVYEFYSEIYDPGFEDAQGNIAPGLIYDYSGAYLTVAGVPTTAGTYKLMGIAHALDGSTEAYSFTIVVEGNGEEIPVPTPAPQLGPEVTKSPTNETVLEGNSAMFIARANDADKIEWYLIEPGTHSAYDPASVVSMYPRLSYKGRNDEVFELYNIPLELNNWQVQCCFINSYGSVVSDYASIYVEEFSTESPTIRSQPQSAEKQTGSSVILSVIADSNSKVGTLKYQWYMSSSPSGNRNPISGANSSSYTPPQTKGTVYYTVAVWSSYEGRDSAKVYSTPAAVSYTEPAPSATPAPTAPPTPTAAPTVRPSPTVKPGSDRDSGSSILLVFIVAMVLAAALAAVILFILRKNAKAAEASPIIPAAKPAPRPAVAESPAKPVKNWLCTCGALNNSPFCTQCGKAKPVVKPCANCGWTPDSPNNIPHFCPECGKPFDEEEF